jgi:glucokinase
LNRRPLYLGLESGGTKLCAALCDERGRLLGFESRARPEGASAADTLATLEALGRRLLGMRAGASSRLAAVGWGFGGIVDRRLRRPVVNFHEAGWDRVDAVRHLRRAFGVPVRIENDCKVAGLAEAWLGAGTRRGAMLYITLGSGIGTGLIRDGGILELGRYGEMEIGHIEAVPGGARCACGRRGCLEAYCSGWGLGARAAERAAGRARRSPVARRIAAADPAERARILLKAWPKDPFARRVVDDFIGKLAPVCAQLISILAPERIVIGGGLARAPGLVAAVGRAAKALLPDRLKSRTVFRRSMLDAQAVSLGAALYAGMGGGPSNFAKASSDKPRASRP